MYLTSATRWLDRLTADGIEASITSTHTDTRGRPTAHLAAADRSGKWTILRTEIRCRDFRERFRRSGS